MATLEIIKKNTQNLAQGVQRGNVKHRKIKDAIAIAPEGYNVETTPG